MKLSYKKLWKMLIDKDMTKTNLQKNTGISKSTLAKLAKGKNVNTEILVKICKALSCDIAEIVEIDEKGDPNEK